MSLQSLNGQIKMAWVALFITALISGIALGQNEAGQVIGRVTDASGAAISGATIIVRSVDTGVERRVMTGNDGFYLVVGLQPSLYDITAQVSGFAPTTKRVEVTVGSRRRTDIELSTTPPAGERPTFEGRGTVDINSQDPQLSDTITGRQIRELPTVTRDPYELITLSGNLTRLDNVGAVGNQNDPAYAINGQRPTTNNVLVDGGENIVNYTTSLGQRLPLDGVQEIQVITNGFRPEFGRFGGGVINVATRHGTNHFHGSLYEFHRNSELSGNSFENSALGIDQGHLVANQFGFSLGGPIFPERFYFFTNAEGNIVRSRENRIALVPTPALLAASSPATSAFFGAFPLGTPINGRVFTVGEVMALTGLAPTPGNAFTALPAGLPAFGQVIYDVPTGIGGGAPQDTALAMGRLDYTLSDRTNIYGRYGYQYRDLYLGTFSSSPFAGFNTGARERNHEALVNVTTSLSSAWIMNGKASFNRLNLVRTGLPGADLPRLSISGFPFANIGGFPIAFPGDQPFDPTWNSLLTGPINLFEAALDFTGPIFGQQFRFGGSYYYTQDNRSAGIFQNGLYTLGANVPQGLSNLVLGTVSTFQTAVNPFGAAPGAPLTLPVVQPDFSRSLSAHDFSLYFSHIWRPQRRVSVSWGLRYDYFGEPRSRNDQIFSNFFLGPDPNPFVGVSTGSLVPAAAAGINGTLYERDWNNVAPRIGAAIDLTGDGRTSLRLGYGFVYDRQFNFVSNFYQSTAGFAAVSLTAGVGGVGPIPLSTSPFGPLGGAAGTIPLPTTSLRAINPDIDSPKVHFWNAVIEREVLPNTVFGVQYVGSAGRDLFTISNVNRPGSAAAFLGSPDPTARLNPAFGPIYFLDANGRSNYHALIVELTNSSWRRLGLNVTARYRYSKSMDNVSAWLGNTFGTFGGSFTTGFLSPFDPGFDYGPSDFDLRHRFIGSFNWEVPFQKLVDRYFGGGGGGSTLVRYALRGWQVAGIMEVHSGARYSVYNCAGAVSAEAPCPRVALNTTLASSGPDEAPADPRVPNQNIFIPGGAFTGAVPGTALPPFPSGTIGRNFFQGPNFWNLDLGISKRFYFTEDTSIQFRGELFNAFNNANLFVPTAVDISSTGYVPAFRSGRRTVQLGLRFLF